MVEFASRHFEECFHIETTVQISLKIIFLKSRNKSQEDCKEIWRSIVSKVEIIFFCLPSWTKILINNSCISCDIMLKYLNTGNGLDDDDTANDDNNNYIVVP
jgi:hypothetical protein